MEVAVAVEQRRPVRETPAERLWRAIQTFFAGLLRTAMLAAVLTPFIILSFFTLDLPVRALDHLSDVTSLKPGNWLRWGGLWMAGVAMAAVLMTRRFGGEEAGRALMAAWGVAAIGAFAEFSYLAPELEPGDLPGVRFVAAYVSSAMLGQFTAIGMYDVLRGGGRWWRAPFYALLAGFGVQTVVYYPIAYWSADAPWPNWLVTDFALKAAMTVVFLGLYYVMRRKLKPRGGFGG